MSGSYTRGLGAPDKGRVVGTAITGTSAGTANTIVTLTADRDILIVLNSCDGDIEITYDGSDFLRLEQGDELALDLRSSQLAGKSGKIFGVYYHTIPTQGSLRLSVL